jgi:hypothetical protein|tara:strand:+ start:26942 stop:27637 length:696 start_codon:yes stop_codon:yes gene_type:complete
MKKTMDIKKQILTALGLEKTNFEFQAKLTDGTIIVSTAPELEAGVDIAIMTEDGTTMPLPVGAYETEDGVGFTVAEDGIVEGLLTEEEIAPSEADESTEEVAAAEEADVADWAGMEKRIANLEDAVADLKAEIGGGSKEETEDTEEVEAKVESAVGTPKTIKKTEVTEFAKVDLAAENKALKAKLEELGKSAGAESLNINKFSTAKPKAEMSKTAYSKLTAKEKFAYNLNN